MSSRTAPLGLALLVAFVSGLVSLSYELVFYRIVSFASWSSPAAFAILLGFFLVGIAVGSRRAGTFCRTTPEPGELHRAALGRVFGTASLVAFAVVPLTGQFASLGEGGGWLLVLPLMAGASGLLGAVLPIAAHLTIPADGQAGARVSYVYIANILGSALGALLTGFVLFDVTSLATTCVILLVIGLAAAAAVSGRGLAWLLTAVAAFVGAAIAPMVFDRLYERLLYKDHFAGTQRFRFLSENRHGVIAVTPKGMVLGGGAYDGYVNVSLRDGKNHLWHAFTVAGFHPRPRRILAIGLSSGSWAQVLANLDGVESLTVVEINPGYLSLIRQSPEVASLLSNPKVHLEIDDGRRWLQRHVGPADERFDVIVMNTVYHWRAQATNLLSREFLETCRQHLLPGGLVLQNYTGSDDVLHTTLATFTHGQRIDWYVAASDSPVTFDVGAFRRALLETRVDGAPLLEPSSRPGDEAVLQELMATVTVAGGADAHREDGASVGARLAGEALITDDNMASEWRETLRYPYPPKE